MEEITICGECPDYNAGSGKCSYRQVPEFKLGKRGERVYPKVTSKAKCRFGRRRTIAPESTLEERSEEDSDRT